MTIYGIINLIESSEYYSKENMYIRVKEGYTEDEITIVCKK